MTESEGVIQYSLDYRPGELPADADYDGLFRWFGRCRKRGLLGQEASRYDGYAYGNISIRVADGFVISGTQTAGKAELTRADLALVEAFDSTANHLRASGSARPSSEAMTHGEVYAALPAVNAVIHVHSPVIWRAGAALGLPTTAPQAGYGTPAMAREVSRLLAQHPVAGVLAMGGHEDGIIAYAADMDHAGDLLLQTLAAAEAQPAK